MSIEAISQYHLSVGEDTMYYYGTGSPGDGQDWVLDGIAFYGCQQSDPNALAVYEFYAPFPTSTNKYRKYAYSTSNNIGGGWNLKSSMPAYYVYSESSSGNLTGLAQVLLRGFDSNAAGTGWGNFYYLGIYPTTYLPAAGYYGEPSFQGWYAMAGNAVIDYTYVSGEYDTKALPPPSSKTFFEQTIYNETGSASITTTLTISDSTTSTFSWGLTESLSVGGTVSVDVKIPLVESTTFTGSLNFDGGSNQTWTTSQQQTISEEVAVTVPAGENVVCYAIASILTDASCPFTMTLLGTATSNNGTTNITLPQQQAAALYQLQNPQSPNAIPMTDSSSIEVTLSGTFTGSYACKVTVLAEDVTSPRLKRHLRGKSPKSRSFLNRSP